MTQRTKGFLQSDINTNIADNTTRQITAADVRESLIDITDSMPFLNGNNTFTGTNTIPGYTSTAVHNAFTGSYLTDSASFANRINSITFDTSSIVTEAVFGDYTASMYSFSSSISSSLDTVSASYAAFSSSYHLHTASWAVNAELATTASYTAYALTASYALSASVEIRKEVSSSYADTASFATTASYVLGQAATASWAVNAQTASIAANATSASYAVSSSNAVTSSFSFYAVTASYAISSSVEIKKEVSSSYAETSSIATSASYALTASYLVGSIESASYAKTSSWAVNVHTSSYALTASYVLGQQATASWAETSSVAITASYVASSSYATTSSFAFYAITASYAISSSVEIKKEVSSSYAETATTASFASNAIKTGSYNASTLTFTRFDNSTFDVTLPGGGGGSGGDSIEISGNNLLLKSGSVTLSTATIYPASSSILPSGVVSSSVQITQGSNIISSSAQLPAGIISSSAQLPSGLISSSAQLPSNTVSSSAQIDLAAAYGTASWSTSSTNAIKTGSYNASILTFTRFDNTTFDVTLPGGGGGAAGGDNIAIVGNNLLLKSGSVTLSTATIYPASSSILPAGTVTSSAQIVAALPTGTVSGSAQVKSLLPTGTVSGSAQVAAILPTGTVSGSAQVKALLPNGTVSSSIQITQGSNLVSSSAQINLASAYGTASWASNAVAATTATTASYFKVVAGPNITVKYTGSGIEISGSAGGSSTVPTLQQVTSQGSTASGSLTFQNTDGTWTSTSSFFAGEINLASTNGTIQSLINLNPTQAGKVQAATLDLGNLKVAAFESSQTRANLNFTNLATGKASSVTADENKITLNSGLGTKTLEISADVVTVSGSNTAVTFEAGLVTFNGLGTTAGSDNMSLQGVSGIGSNNFQIGGDITFNGSTYYIGNAPNVIAYVGNDGIATNNIKFDGSIQEVRCTDGSSNYTTMIPTKFEITDTVGGQGIVFTAEMAPGGAHLDMKGEAKIGVDPTAPGSYVEINSTAYTNGINAPGTINAGVDLSSGGTKTFKIPHPLTSMSGSHWLLHSCIEGPEALLIYDGPVAVVNGTGSINLDTYFRMTPGTFTSLTKEARVMVTNNTTWDQVKGEINGADVTVYAKDGASVSEVRWMVLAERNDAAILSNPRTDLNGDLILEVEM